MKSVAARCQPGSPTRLTLLTFLISPVILLFLSLVVVAVQALALRMTMPVNQYRKSQTVSLYAMRLNFPLGRGDQKLWGSCVPLCFLESFHSHQDYKA
jgi:hypothetical protein